MPTIEQLQEFYRATRRAVLLSSYVSFVELAENGSLYVYFGHYDRPLARTIVSISPSGEVNYE